MADDKFSFKHVFTSANTGLLEDFYDLEKKLLGEGSYGKVAVGRQKTTGALRAIKTMDIRRIKDKERFQQEMQIHMNLDHPNIVKLYETFVDARRFYLVMELCTGGELFDRIVELSERHEGRAFGEQDVARYMQQILGAIRYLHSRKYVHRDIKPENFLLQNKSRDAEIKVIDFGLAKHSIQDDKMKTKAGTPYYVAPEVLLGDGYDEKCDIWSCGVICYILVCGYPPFFGDNDSDILKRVKRGTFKFVSSDWDHVSQRLKDFISKMLTVDAALRPSAEDLFDHPWLANITPDDGQKVLFNKNVASNMRRFGISSKLKKVVLTMIAKNMKDCDIEDLRKSFIALDKNKDGILTQQELVDGLKKAHVPMPNDFHRVLDSLDTDGSGTIDYTEFLASTLSKKQYLKEEAAWSAFRMFDKDGDGEITKEELALVLADNELEVSAEIMKEVDTDNSGTISFDEFKGMLSKGL